MKSFKALPVAFALLLCAVGAFAATHAISLDSSVSQIALEMREGDALRFHVDVAELQATDVATPEGMFSRLTIPGFHSSQDVGAPNLPMLNRLFEIPLGATAQVENCWVVAETAPVVFDFKCELVGTTGTMYADVSQRLRC